MSCGVGFRGSLDPTLLWLWHRLAATAPIRPLAWESPYAVGVAQAMQPLWGLDFAQVPRAFVNMVKVLQIISLRELYQEKNVSCPRLILR